MTTRVRPRLRDLTSADAARILDLTRATGVFRDEELLIAEEVFCDCVNHPGPTGGVGTDPLVRPTGSADPGAAADPLVRRSPVVMDRPYYALGAELDGVLAGWICWGQTPCTDGTWDLYWMAVDPALHGSGVGTTLVDEMERRLLGRARLIAVDTSGRADYAPTRAFYAARGYQAVATVPDFYAPGDDQVIYTKVLPRTVSA
ncbi:MAG: GNAT family N-acetyltransferase [Gemmatimonadota bacterium]|nr:GNAT family N-acetyltransferase [Gemmatimonadota bacterium]